MNNWVVIMSGVSGSGKSSYIQNVITTRLNGNYGYVSADQYFGRDGEYKFDASKLSAAHADCFLRFITILNTSNRPQIILVDNTNTTTHEISPYVLGAEAFGYQANITTIKTHGTDLTRCAERNLHNVPYQGILQQYKRIVERNLPPWWNHNWVEMGR